MNLLTRYILFELGKVMIVTVVTMTGLMILVGVGQTAVRQGLGLGPIAQLIPYLLPNALCFAVPGALLFTACSVYGRMSADNEIIALKAAGVSPLAAIWPVLILGFAMSLMVVWLNDIAFSWGNQGMQRVVVQSVEEIAYGMLATQRSYVSRRFAINVKRVEGRTLVRPTITLQATGTTPAVLLTAREAELRFNAEENALSIFLTDGTIEAEGVATMEFTDTIERVVPLTDDAGEHASSDASHLPMGEIPAAIDKQTHLIHVLEQTLATETAYDLVTGDFDSLSSPRAAQLRDDLGKARARLHRLTAEPWRRWASGFSCLAFVLVGAPLAVRLRTNDVMTTFGLCFLPTIIVYYPFLIWGISFAKDGSLPPYCLWVGNVVYGGIGGWLLWWVRRY